MAIVTYTTSKILQILLLFGIFLGTQQREAAAQILTSGFRPPAVPLAVVDPYFRYVLYKIQARHSMMLELLSQFLGEMGVVIHVHRCSPSPAPPHPNAHTPSFALISNIIGCSVGLVNEVEPMRGNTNFPFPSPPHTHTTQTCTASGH